MQELLREQLVNCKPLLIQGIFFVSFSSYYHLFHFLERVADDPWKVLVAVTLLNKTAGKVAIPVFWKIIERWPTPLDLAQGICFPFLPVAWWFTQFTANPDELISLIRKLGTQTVRSKRLIQLSKIYLQDPPSVYDLRRSRTTSSPQRKSRFFISSRAPYPATPISHLPGAGTYALDSYRIFCCTHHDPTSEEWKLVRPTDKELIRYLVSPKFLSYTLSHTVTYSKRWKWAFHEHLEWSPSKGAIGQITPQYLTALIDDIQTNQQTN